MAKILIIGAGMAGLAAAQSLQANGFDVTLLEARNRCGGRIWTDSSELGIPFDHGAAWIHGVENNPIAALAKTCRLHFKTVDFESFIFYDENNQAVPRDMLNQFNEHFDHALTAAKEYAKQQTQDVSLANALQPFFNATQLTAQQQAIYKQRLAYFEGYMGENYQRLSAINWDLEQTLPGGNALLQECYESIINHLAHSCDIRLNTIVTDIHEKNNQIEVTTTNGQYGADYVLVTVSLGVLKKQAIHFHPPLSHEKQDAIARMGMGLLNVVVLKFSQPFWPDHACGFFLSAANADTPAVFLNFSPIKQQPILIAYVGGTKGQHIETLSDDTIITNTLAALRKQFGELPELQKYFITRWSQDPFSYGAYSYPAVGVTPDDYNTLAKPASARIYFAGEATNRDFPATTHGAYWSGLREAERIISHNDSKGHVS